jgi:hypothetical protein
VTKPLIPLPPNQVDALDASTDDYYPVSDMQLRGAMVQSIGFVQVLLHTLLRHRFGSRKLGHSFEALGERRNTDVQ